MSQETGPITAEILANHIWHICAEAGRDFDLMMINTEEDQSVEAAVLGQKARDRIRDYLAPILAAERAKQISGFYEEEYPSYQQGEPMHELQELVTAEECNGLVAKLKEAREQIAAERVSAAMEMREACAKACENHPCKVMRTCHDADAIAIRALPIPDEDRLICGCKRAG